MIKEYPMRVVSKITGLSADQIRKWEERYPILKINRSRKGSRRFTDRDLEILQLMNEAKSIGFTLQEIGTLKLIDLRNLVGEIRSGEKKIEYPEIEKLNNLTRPYFDSCIECTKTYNVRKLEKNIYDVALELGNVYVIHKFIIPFIKQKIPDLKVILAVHGEPLENYSPYFYERDCFEIHDYKIPDKDVSSFFERSKIVVTPYIEASQSGIIALAYSFGRPVVSTAVGSLTEVVNSDKTGFLVKPKEVKPLALAVIRLLKNKKLYNHMSKECYNYAYNELSWDNIATKTIELYRGCDK